MENGKNWIRQISTQHSEELWLSAWLLHVCSTTGEVQYTGDIIEYTGGCSVHRGVPPVHQGIPCTSERTRGYYDECGGYHEYTEFPYKFNCFPNELPPHLTWYPSGVLMISPRCSWYPPTVLMVSSRCTEIPQCTAQTLCRVSRGSNPVVEGFQFLLLGPCTIPHFLFGNSWQCDYFRLFYYFRLNVITAFIFIINVGYFVWFIWSNFALNSFFSFLLVYILDTF